MRARRTLATAVTTATIAGITLFAPSTASAYAYSGSITC